MVYIPNNTAVFNAAANGALCGILTGKAPVSAVAATYVNEATAALAIAQEFDTLYGATGNASPFNLDTIQNVIAALFARWAGSIAPTDYVLLANAAVALVNELNTVYGTVVPAGNQNISSYRARNVVTANVAALATFTVAGNDGVTNVAGDIVLLAAQATVAQNGPYVVGTVAAGVAPLTRPSWWQTGSTIKTGTTIAVGGEGTLFKNTNWEAMLAADSFIVGTNDPQMFPQQVTTQLVLVAGTATTGTTIPIRSLKTGVTITRTTGNTPAATIMYCATVANATGITPGAIGTGSLVIQAVVAAGTINVADISTVNVTINNQL